MAVCGGCDARDGERIRSRGLPRTGLARVGGDDRLSAGWAGCRPTVRRGVEWLAAGPGPRLNWVSQGQCLGRCKVRRRAERVIRPARAKNRRRRVLVVTICSPKPMRAVQRARLWAITCTANQAPLAANRPDGMWFSPTPYLRSRMAFKVSAWRRYRGLDITHSCRVTVGFCSKKSSCRPSSSFSSQITSTASGSRRCHLCPTNSNSPLSSRTARFW